MSEVFRLDAPYRQAFGLHVLDFGSGPVRLAVVAGLHGNELNGVHAVNLVARALAYAQPKGRVRLIPVVNSFGMDQGTKRWPVDDMDINQAFPGDPNGSPVQRIAAAVLESTAAEVCVDVHSGSPLVRELPQVRVPLTGREVGLARSMGLPLVWRRDGDRIEATGLVGAWRLQDRAALHVVGGRGGTLDVATARQMADGLLRMINTMGLARVTVDPNPETLETTRREVSYSYSDLGGFWVPEVEVGDRVGPGHVLGTINEVIGGRPVAEIRADQPGVIITMRRYPVVHAGELLVRVARSP